MTVVRKLSSGLRVEFDDGVVRLRHGVEGDSIALSPPDIAELYDAVESEAEWAEWSL